MKNVFVPLYTKHFNDFKSGVKTEELRLYGKRWNEKTCLVGRKITLSKGYGKHERLYGTISKFKKQHGSLFGSTYRADILERYGTIDVLIACISIMYISNTNNQ